MGRHHKSSEDVVSTFKERHGTIAADMLLRWDTDPTVTIGKIARKIGTTRQNVHSILTRIGKKKRDRRIVRPWGKNIFHPEVESLLRYLFNRFNGNVQHLGRRQFRVNGKKVMISRREAFNGTCLNIATANLYERDSADYKIILHSRQVFVVPFIREYLPISEMPRYHNRYDLLEQS